VRSTVTSRVHPFALPKQRQGETLAVIGDGHEAYVGSEGVAQEIYRVALPPLAESSPTAAPSGSAAPGPGSPSGPPTVERSKTQTAAGGLVLIGLVGLTWVVVLLRRRKRQRMRSTR
jgi:hypothetical protein